VDLRVAWILAGAVLVGSVVTLWARPDVRITGTELEHHERYDRLVVQLSGPTEVLRRPETSWRDLIIDLRAIPRQQLQELETEYPRVGTLVIEETLGGARLSSTRRERRLRLFKLEDPTRLVVDFADPDNLLLSAPGEAWGIPTVSPPGPELAFASGDDDAALEPSEEARQSVTFASRAAWLAEGWLVAAPLAALLGFALFAGLQHGLADWRRLRLSLAARAWGATSVSPPAERPEPAGAHVARRHDEEVAARIQLEERVLELQEEVRQLRARLTRLSRQREERA